MESMDLQENQINFNDLDEVCLGIIFKFLSLNELAAMSLTCRRYKVEAERYFTLHREIHCLPIKIKSTMEEINFDFKPDSEYKYERVFESLIRSVDCSFHGTFTPDDCNFINKYCAEQLSSLTLNIINGSDRERIDGSPIALIQGQLKNLKDLKLVNFFVRDLYGEVLSHCLSLQSMIIDINRYGSNEFHGIYGDSWLKQCYPNLETLHLYVPKRQTIHIDTFLSLNPNLKNFVCSNLWAIFDVCHSETEFQHVAFIFSHEHDFTWTMEAMEKWLKQKRCEDFELVISVHEFAIAVIHRMATNFENITSLHLGLNIDHLILWHSDISLPSVKMLCVDFTPMEGLPILPGQFVYDQMNRLFPNLTKLKMKVKVEDHSNDIFDVVHRFKELKNFEFINENCDLCNKIH